MQVYRSSLRRVIFILKKCLFQMIIFLAYKRRCSFYWKSLFQKGSGVFQGNCLNPGFMKFKLHTYLFSAHFAGFYPRFSHFFQAFSLKSVNLPHPLVSRGIFFFYNFQENKNLPLRRWQNKKSMVPCCATKIKNSPLTKFSTPPQKSKGVSLMMLVMIKRAPTLYYYGRKQHHLIVSIPK